MSHGTPPSSSVTCTGLLITKPTTEELREHIAVGMLIENKLTKKATAAHPASLGQKRDEADSLRRKLVGMRLGKLSYLKSLTQKWSTQAVNSDELLQWAEWQRRSQPLGGTWVRQPEVSLVLSTSADNGNYHDDEIQRDAVIVHWSDLQHKGGRPVTLDNDNCMIYPVPFLVAVQSFAKASIILPGCGVHMRKRKRIMAILVCIARYF